MVDHYDRDVTETGNTALRAGGPPPLFVSRNTVKSHASHIYTKLGVSSRAAAADAARALGLV